MNSLIALIIRNTSNFMPKILNQFMLVVKSFEHKNIIRMIIPLGGLLFLSTGGSISCSETEPNAVVERGQILGDPELAYHADTELIQFVLAQYGYDTINISHGIDVYRIQYYTVDHQENFLATSGAILMSNPFPTQATPIVSVQHGTIFHDDLAPSHFSQSSLLKGNTLVEGLPFIIDSNPPIVFMADYLGIGDDDPNFIHPYVHAKTISNAVIDGLRATQTFLEQKSIQFNQKVFLAGYSEGGYATLATMKALENDYSESYTLMGAASGAGPYDLVVTGNRYLEQETLPFSPYLMYCIAGYAEVYPDLQFEWNEIVLPSYDEKFPRLLDGTYDSGEILDELTSDRDALIQPSFIEGFTNQTGLGGQFAQHLGENNLILGWTPKAPLWLFHGTNDDIVPFENSEQAYNTFTNNGTEHTDTISLDDSCSEMQGHGNCGFAYEEGAKAFFDLVNQ